MNFFNKLKQFFKNIAHDERIPGRDKKILLIFVILIFSPIDLIPDWIPFFGKLDDFIMLAFIFDYFFQTLDSRILLSLYPWDMKSFARLRAIGRFMNTFVPRSMKKKLWKYEGDPY
jgi:uncharacterized membrane protein YkvA (DUF1232 family)